MQFKPALFKGQLHSSSYLKKKKHEVVLVFHNLENSDIEKI